MRYRGNLRVQRWRTRIESGVPAAQIVTRRGKENSRIVASRMSSGSPRGCAQVRSGSPTTCLPCGARRSGLCSDRRLPARHRDQPGRCICRQKRSRGFRFSRGVGHTDDVTLRQRKKIPLPRCQQILHEVDVCNAIAPGTMRDKGCRNACVSRARRGRYLAVEKAGLFAFPKARAGPDSRRVCNNPDSIAGSRGPSLCK